MNDSTKKTAEWWNDPQSQPCGTQWTEVPMVSQNINRRATGDSAIDWINHSASFLNNQMQPVKALSIGCGLGIIERILRRRHICRFIHGLDVAESAIEGARQEAKAEGLDGLTYEISDLNTVELPADTYDAVYAHASLHHIFHLEHLLDQIKKTLKPGGLFVIYEYIGPSQMQFPQHHLQLADVFLRSIPERYRRLLRQNGVKQEVARLSLQTMKRSDPSEGIRASEIVPLVASRFELRHFRYIGGTLLLLIFNEIAGNFKADDAEIMPLVNALITLDNFLVDSAVLPSYHVYMVCQKSSNPLPMQTKNVLPPAAPVFPTDCLETPITAPAGSITADPNPFTPDARGSGETTLAWTSYATSKVEIHVNAPDGNVFTASGPGSFSKTTARWVRDGMKFYLQNVSNDLPLTRDNTIATVTLRSTRP